LSVATVLLWIVVAVGTISKCLSGKLNYAPCLAALKIIDCRVEALEKQKQQEQQQQLQLQRPSNALWEQRPSNMV
jgi:hypothetical protein